MLNTIRNPVAPRAGVTVVEVLVVTGIAGLLAALLLPAIQSSREASRRMTCSSHLRQIGIAVGNYTEAYHKLPPYSLRRMRGFLFPDVDATALMWSPLPILACPSDSVSLTVRDTSHITLMTVSGWNFRVTDSWGAAVDQFVISVPKA